MMRRDYRIYKIDDAGRMLGAPVIYSARSDETALGFALQTRADHEGISVWQAGRLVQEFGPNCTRREVRAKVCQSETTEAFYALVNQVPLTTGV